MSGLPLWSSPKKGAVTPGVGGYTRRNKGIWGRLRKRKIKHVKPVTTVVAA